DEDVEKEERVISALFAHQVSMLLRVEAESALAEARTLRGEAACADCNALVSEREKYRKLGVRHVGASLCAQHLEAEIRQLTEPPQPTIGERVANLAEKRAQRARQDLEDAGLPPGTTQRTS